MEKKHNVTQPDTLQREWTRIVAQAWADPDFRKRLEKNPRAVLKERGVDVPGDVDLQVIDKPIEMEGIEQAVKPVPMAVAAGFAAPPMPMPQQASQFPGGSPDYYTGGYVDPTYEAYAAAADPTLEAAKWKVGLCISSRATIGACPHFQWGAAQPQSMQQPFPTQQCAPQQAMPAPSPYATPQQPPTAAWGGAETMPYYSGDIYSGGGDPTLDARRIKVGLCPNSKLTAGVCAYFHWGAGQPQPMQQPFPTQQYMQQPQAPMPPYAAPQQPPPTSAFGGAEAPPYYGGDIYGGAADPTLEAAKWKVGLCISSRATIGACVNFNWGTAQPQPMQQPFPTQQYMQQPQAPMPPYAAPQQPPPTSAFGGAETPPYYGGDIYGGAADPTLEAAKWKVGLCISSRATIGACVNFHWGAAQPQPMQQPMQQPFQMQQCQPQQPPTAAYGGPETLPYYGGDIYSGMEDPTLDARRIKVGLCPSSKLTAGVCAYFHWGAGQPQPMQQFMPPQGPMPASPYGPPQQPPSAAYAGDIYSGAGTPQQAPPQQQNIGWAATVPTQCFSGAAAPQLFVPGVPQPGYPQYHIQPSPGPQHRPAKPGSA